MQEAFLYDFETLQNLEGMFSRCHMHIDVYNEFIYAILSTHEKVLAAPIIGGGGVLQSFVHYLIILNNTKRFFRRS